MLAFRTVTYCTENEETPRSSRQSSGPASLCGMSPSRLLLVWFFGSLRFVITCLRFAHLNAYIFSRRPLHVCTLTAASGRKQPSLRYVARFGVPVAAKKAATRRIRNRPLTAVTTGGQVAFIDACLFGKPRGVRVAKLLSS